MMNPTRLFDIPYFQQEHFPLEDALVTKVNGVWEKRHRQATFRRQMLCLVHF